MSQDYYGNYGNSRFASSWSVINNDDEDHRYYPSYTTETWSVLNSQDVNEDQPQNNYDGGFGLNNYGSSTASINTTIRQERNSSLPPEPEFAPSISSSTKGFIETTFKYERRNPEDIVGRPEDDDDCPPLDSSSFLNDDSQYTPTASNIESTTNSSSLSYLWYPIVVVIIAIIIYYIGMEFIPSVELDDIF